MEGIFNPEMYLKKLQNGTVEKIKIDMPFICISYYDGNSFMPQISLDQPQFLVDEQRIYD